MDHRKYLVDVVITQTKTMEVLAPDREEASKAVKLWTAEDILMNPAKTRTSVEVSPPVDPNEPTFL